MKALTVIAGLISFLVTALIWPYLLYKILQSVNATELMWFLYWIYLPAAILAGIISVVIKKDD